MSQVVRCERDDGVAVIIIDNPPINAGSHAVRAGILSAIVNAEADPAIQAIVLIGDGTTFIAGSDLREFGQPIAAPQLPEVIAAIEACPKPVVAALHGAALGGGLELALGCDSRIAMAGTKVGLPEVTLGIIPGAGGTQRLPRLVGVPKAIELICRGTQLTAEDASALGIVNQIVTQDLRAAAVAHARAVNGQKALIRELAVPAADDIAIEKASADALRAGRNRPAVQAAIAAIRATQQLPFDDGLAQERASFQQLRISREARALRHQFFAERAAGKTPDLTAIVRKLDQVGVIGAGTMGTGIAIATLDTGLMVTLLERDAEALSRGITCISEHYQSRVNKGALNAQTAAATLARLQSSLDWSRLSTMDLIIEAVFEDLGVKQDVLRKIDAVARSGAILATNTSYLDVDALAAVTARPHDVIGLHFFSPANLMRLLEVVRGAETSPDVLATGLAFARRLKKIAVVSGNAFGFIGNRIYAAYRRQCEFLIEEGASPQQVDKALEVFGFAMGPFAVGDMSGLDIAWRMRQSLAATRNPDHRYVTIPDELCEAGRFGRKTGAGYYLYPQGTNKGELDPQVEALIANAREKKGIVARDISPEEITSRVLLAMVNEACLLLSEGVARRASDVDVVLVNGYGFPKWEGGPIFWAQDRGVDQLKRDLDWLAERSGPGFVRADTAVLTHPADVSVG